MPIAIDYNDSENLLIATREGKIIEYCSFDAEPASMDRVYSHSNGEVWGLADNPGNTFATTGDDNKVMTWLLTEKVEDEND
jgi:hypothetical protein